MKHWQEAFTLYAESWKRVMHWRTLWHALIDVGLIVLFFVVLLLFSLISTNLFAPFAEAVDIKAIEQGLIPAQAAPMMLSAAGLSPDALVYRLLTAGLVVTAVYMLLYSLLKLLVWESVTGRSVAWRLRLRLIAWTVAAALAVVIVIYLAIKVFFVFGALAILLALATLLFVKPYVYARVVLGRRPERLAKRFWTMVLFAAITFIGVSNLLGALTLLSLYFGWLLLLFLLLYLSWVRSYLATVLEVEP